ncbi:hypothetical protein RB195_005397 [Necator americanus]|uniref:Uncharacterized protein n=1 Tax=Necator americanus TaxID=51031 RepID=A0ABR1BML7_NECAM
MEELLAPARPVRRSTGVKVIKVNVRCAIERSTANSPVDTCTLLGLLPIPLMTFFSQEFEFGYGFDLALSIVSERTICDERVDVALAWLEVNSQLLQREGLFLMLDALSALRSADE